MLPVVLFFFIFMMYCVVSRGGYIAGLIHSLIRYDIVSIIVLLYSFYTVERTSNVFIRLYDAFILAMY